MSATDRQNRLLVAEDWKRVYQSFRTADFQSYDFDNLRRTMIQYLRENYPEDFNDYIESSEYLALIDLIAFLGQNMAFRIDLNARENFLELAERRESVLRLARLLSYNPKRNQAANGLLKFTSVKTSETVLDSSGFNLAGQTVLWNDSTNSNWNEQFTRILNAALPVNGTVGRPSKKDTVSGIPTEQYRFNALNTTVPVFTFDKNIEGQNAKFQVVSTDIDNGDIIEEAPLPGNNFAFLYRNDSSGPGSSNTGYFAHFRQGTLDTGNFSITNPNPNQAISIDTININDSDVWLYKLDSNNAEGTLWTKVEAVEGNNIIYNSLNKNIRSIYSVITRVDDRINLMFSDGVFGDLPKGNFRVYYRTSANRNLIITPRALSNITIQIPYLSKAGKAETLTIGLDLKYTVSNGAPSESSASIKSNAPATYYTQNRMVTGEDYNVAPLGISQDIVKVKSVNRTSSGISRFFDVVDATGKYSSTNLYGNDGVVYKEKLETSSTFSFVTQTDIEGVILNIIEPTLQNTNIRNFYYSEYPQILVADLGVSWVRVTNDTNNSTGYLVDADNVSVLVSSYTSNNLRLLNPGTLCRFIAPTGKCFDKDNNLVTRTASKLGDKNYIWSKVVRVTGNGVDALTSGLGPIAFSDAIPEGAILNELKPQITSTIPTDVKTQIIDHAYSYKTFGLRFDNKLGQWRLITPSNIDVNTDFNTGKTGDKTSQNLDASWLLKFETNGELYTLTYRGLRYIFESDKEIRFYYDSTDKIYDTKTGKIIKDKITVLNINTQPDSISPFTTNFDWEIVSEYRDKEGYVDSTKIEVSFFDIDDDGVVDNPELFTTIVDEETNTIEKYIFQERFYTQNGTEDYRFVTPSSANIITYADEALILLPTTGEIYFLEDERKFKILNSDGLLEYTTDYRAFYGRSDLKFHYVHSADSDTRIDPSVSNIIDTYMLTRGYDVEFRKYLDNAISYKPLPPSSDQLFRDYGKELNKIKSISDEVIYHPVKYKVLFGNKAKEDLQAVFKVIKNPDLVLNDNDIKSRVIQAINQYFALENWDFGSTFYFQELATYITNSLAPDLVTIIIVPRQLNQTFGSLFEIRSEADEIFINGATVDSIEIIDEITASKLKAAGNVVTASTYENAGIQSSAASTSSTNTGGFDY